MYRPKAELAQQALQKSVSIRRSVGFDDTSAVCIYSICDALNIQVRFVDINMEGMYVKGNKPKILISAQRPAVRRTFSCAHELGHHAFGHGTSADHIVDQSGRQSVFQPEEFIVDSFAGFILMPMLAVRRAFGRRQWNPRFAEPEQIYTIACYFGVGYETLITHMNYSLQMISESDAKRLLRTSPKEIKHKLSGPETDTLTIVDEYWDRPTLDAEVGNTLLLPEDVCLHGNIICEAKSNLFGKQFKAVKPGLIRITSAQHGIAIICRIAQKNYVGLSQFRHLEDDDE